MYEMGINHKLFGHILDGSKTIEIRLRTPKFVTLRKGDEINFRKDTWHDNRLVESLPNQARALVLDTTFFDSFDEAITNDNFKAAAPSADDVQEAINLYSKHYSAGQIQEHGVVAIRFKLLP